ncbi:hypothetical protein bpr_II406 (plasmid) [Butyrivibrio proteoclasticus B316]|uniref:Uncharacterized protein n=1 Tax=Butyrivibrio proteoclasticus (strain ATCC 51982 / DSM 14932 / B316) TaxID=515622 RepID=E0S4L1_BUTPB|nr:DUF5688 family protein [Butyrivibrio proteoclasticus]ADL36343.1 hypothetical protein bpr_II406 [Butyrivibrio proteoclasticus B316]
MITKEDIVKALSEEGYEVRLVTKHKNHKTKEGITIRQNEEMTAPTLYMDEIPLDKYTDLKELISDIKDFLSRQSTRGDDLKKLAENIDDYNTVKDKLYIEIVSATDNEEFLSSMPHRKVLDFEVIFKLKLSDYAVASVSNALLEAWGVDIETLFNDAMASSEKNMPYGICHVSDVIPKPLTSSFINVPMYIVFRPDDENGAAAILYPEFQEFVGKQIGGFYILPSSIHECIMVPDAFYQLGGASEDVPGALKEMVSLVNKECVPKEDLLSDNAYHYDPNRKVLEFADEYFKNIKDA